MARLVRLREVSNDIGLSKWSIARLEAIGAFPQRIKIGKYAVAYDADELAEWKAARKAARRTAVVAREQRPET